MDIVVLAGGLSQEREVSLSSGALICRALRNRGHRAVLVDLFFGYDKPYTDPAEIFAAPYVWEEPSIDRQAPDIDAIRKSRNQDNDDAIGANVVEICRAADIVFMALHGDLGENGKLQALFDIHGIRYTGTGYLGSALAMHKGVAKELFAANHIPTPAGITLDKAQPRDTAHPLPCVVKPASGGSSVGTSIAHTESEYQAALDLAFQYEDMVIVEQYIKGREFDVGVLDGKALPVIEIIPKNGFYNYENKYQSGMTEEVCPAHIPVETAEALQDLAQRVFRALRMEVYSRMDFIQDEQTGQIYCLEGNTLPGMTPLSLLPQEAAAVGISYEELCETIIRLSMEKYQ